MLDVPTLADDLVTLRPVERGDIDAITEACQDPEIPRYAMIRAIEVRADPAWARVVVRRLLGGEKPAAGDLADLIGSLKPEDRESLLLEAAEHKRFSGADRWALLALADHRWSPEFSARVLQLLAESAPPVVRAACRIVARLTMIVLGAGLAVLGAILMADSWDVAMAGAALPVGVRFFPVALGGALIAVFGVERLVAGLRERAAAPAAAVVETA